MVRNNTVLFWDNLRLVTIFVHGVNADSNVYGTLIAMLRNLIQIPQGKFEQTLISFNWAISKGVDKNGKIKISNPTLNASDSIGERSNKVYGMSKQQWNAVTDLKKLVADLHELIKSDDSFSCETINIVAHSQGTLITLTALQESMSVDTVIFTGSPMDKEIIKNAEDNTDIAGGAKNTAKIVNLWSSSDDVARLKGGIGGFCLPKNKIAENFVDVKLDGVDHYGDSGWWNGSWLNKSDNLKLTSEYFSDVFFGNTDMSKWRQEKLSKLEEIKNDAKRYR